MERAKACFKIPQHMKTLRCWLVIWWVGAAVSISAAEKPKAETYLDPATAGPDYADQGEYTNDWGGAQVIALGEDNFRLVIHKGGLPGAGWDQSAKTELAGHAHPALGDPAAGAGH